MIVRGYRTSGAVSTKMTEVDLVIGFSISSDNLRHNGTQQTIIDMYLTRRMLMQHPMS